MCQLQLLLLVILLVTVLVLRSVIYLEHFVPMSHGVNKKECLPPPLPLIGFHQASCFTSNTLSTFLCSDLTDYCKNIAFSK